MTVRTSVLWKMKIHMAKKWPEKVVQRSFIKEHSFPNGLYLTSTCQETTNSEESGSLSGVFSRGAAIGKSGNKAVF